ncbi:PREDICTED: uncharacterized protein LOC109584368 [Amphimedon queenslandica]|uniref:Uncharacterized protein n=1 Tax=Amphimedon queenslandica TaxID=400682 RepID=A0AAN0JFS0_AMPQE|nr:PREDICTED: uncharacterized protein LOC109584368 [Amphimedon queenslandica]|eukprot:XP_019855637.1 PREDICTED: uncharacterized protein LOC109584368 [Amphimedon queenslandica]
MEHIGGYRNERIEEWMEQQEVSSFESFCGCCDPQTVKRRRARYVLFKQLVLEEIEKRSRKYEDKLLPEEKEAIEEVKEKFSRGNYSKIKVSRNHVGTFYTPITLILSTIHPGEMLPLLFPTCYTLYWTIKTLRMQDQSCACLMYTLLPITLFLMVFVELALLAISIVFCYGFYFLSSYGVLHYTFQISLIEQDFGIFKKAHKDTVRRTIRHAPFRRLYSRPIFNIFQDMEIVTYDFGEINGQLVTQDGINSYNRYYVHYGD